ncbi:hypothetical protein SCHPADRAFT_998237 [Schizopora paradoxa]|uniref:Uncharacterized protein n=1 Tax=Schizopora paradoxa TaxID=27342 RepID=A0A0H2RSA3_9AGAM|nr:hypothetical protein SCHPADRAFT_998237 [Schizopora paradoxa]
MSKLLAKIKGQTTHKDSSDHEHKHDQSQTNDRPEERQFVDRDSNQKETEAPKPQAAQPSLMSYESTNNSGVCGARGGKKSEEPVEEQRFSIQPHPARTNDPRDLQPGDEQDFMSPGRGACSARAPLAPGVFSMPGPVIPNAAQHQEIPPPSSRDELRARSAELNQSSNNANSQ